MLDAFDDPRWWRRFVTGPTQDGKTLLSFCLPILYHLFELREDVIVGVPNIDMAQHRIASGSGIGVLYCIAGDADDRLVRLFDEPIDVIDMNIVYHQSMRGSARLRAVLDLLIAFHVERRAALGGRKS